MSKDFQAFIRDGMLQDTQGKIAALKSTKVDTLIVTLDFSMALLTRAPRVNFITTDETQSAILMTQDAVEESAKVTAIALPYNYLLAEDGADYPAGLLATRLGLGRFNNPGMLGCRGNTTSELYRTYLQKLRHSAALERSKL